MSRERSKVRAAGAAQALLGSADAFDLLPDAVVVVARDGAVIAANELALRLLDLERGALEGHPAPRTLRLRDESGGDWWDCAEPFAADPDHLPRIPEQFLSLRLAGGKIRPVALTASRVPGPDGATSHLLLVLRRAEGRHRRDTARSDLVSTVSHELRSPLTSVKGFTKTLLAKWERFTDDQKRQMLATVNEDADRVTRLLGELLDVSRIDAGRLQLKRQMVDVGELAQRVVDRLSAGDGVIPVSVGIAEEVPQLYADPDKIEQVFTNLVENALKYAEAPVRVDAAVAVDVVQVTVSDSGPGIEELELRRIFTKFYRRAGERRAGTGLGLYITKVLVESHGGDVWAESAPGQGSHFHFTLPRGGLELAGIDLDALLHRNEREAST